MVLDCFCLLFGLHLGIPSDSLLSAPSIRLVWFDGAVGRLWRSHDDKNKERVYPYFHDNKNMKCDNMI